MQKSDVSCNISEMYWQYKNKDHCYHSQQAGDRHRQKSDP